MNIGFIGAGKVGFSLGKYFKEAGISVSGYYSHSSQSSAEAAAFTQTKSYNTISEILDVSDALFVTTSDGAIGQIWDQMKNLNVKNKMICHCSGSITSTVFFNGENLGASIFSIHPLYAISDKYTSWKGLKNAHFTVEGSSLSIEKILNIFKQTNNPVTIISKENKALYHCAATTASNLAVGLFKTAVDMLKLCNFTEEEAIVSLFSLFASNTENMANTIACKEPLYQALTGPIERNDIETVNKHLAALDCLEHNTVSVSDEGKELLMVYKILSQKLLDLATAKDPSKDYSTLKEVLQ